VSHRVRARPPRGEPRRPLLLDGSDSAAYLQDAARTPGGHARRVALPRTEAEIAWVLRDSSAVLPVGAQSSLTGGATPFGETVLSLSRLDTIGPITGDGVEVEAGVPLLTLIGELRRHRLFYPPVPTFWGALAGGTAATNAAGAATFKYGATRRWVESLCVLLASGDVLELERGQCLAHPDGYFEIESAAGALCRVPIPSYRMPDVAKRSAGYHAEPNMDLVDLFIGSEGTLGVISRLRLRVRPDVPRLLGWVTLRSEVEALRLVAALRDAARTTWRAHDPRGLDVAAIESLDRRCLALLREDGSDREHGLRLAPEADAALLFQVELPSGTDAAAALEQIGGWDEPGAGAGPLSQLCRLVGAAGALDAMEVALPGDTRRADELLAVREAVPKAVNQRIAAAQRGGERGVHKTAADMIVPFDGLAEMIALYREGFARRGLDHALWGHVSDGNLHANAIPRSTAEVELAEQAILEFGEHVARLGGCPLSEHGVGRSPVKQELLRRLYGDDGIREMRRTKAALDPESKLAPGLVFPAATSA